MATQARPAGFPALDRRRTNPISLRVWYPRLVTDTSFARLVAALKYIRADRVYLFDNGYMDNFQLAPETLAERLPVLTRRIAQLKKQGILAGVNSGATIGHNGNVAGAERLLDLDWWVGADGAPLVGIACPLGARFGQWLDGYFRGLAGTGAQEIFIDDDFRMDNHSAPPPGDWGCFCDLHLAEMRRRYGHDLTREQLITEIGKTSPGRVREDWLSLWKGNFLDLHGRMEKAVHGVDPDIRLGLMTVQNFVVIFGEDFLQSVIGVISGTRRPLLRPMAYHGLPHEMTPGWGVTAKRTAPPESEHLAEIENRAHNQHEFIRSPQTTRYAILSALALGMGGAAPTFGDSERDMPWERRYLDMLRKNDRFFRTVADLTYRGTVMRGIPIRHRAFQRSVRHIDWKDDGGSLFSEHADRLAGMYGVAYQFDDCPVWLLGQIPATMTSDEINRCLDRGAVIDLAGLKCLWQLGYGQRLGVKAGEQIVYRRGHRFLKHPLNAEYGGDINALRIDFPVHHLQADAGRYDELTEFVSWTGKRVAGGILAQKKGRGRNVILPHTLSLDSPYASGIVNTQYRGLMRRVLAFCLGGPPVLTVEGPPRIAPYYFERSDGAVVITLLNAYYDDVYDFDLVLGDGRRLASRKVRRVMPDGRLKWRPSLKVRRGREGVYRVRVDKANALKNCDALVLLLE